MGAWKDARQEVKTSGGGRPTAGYKCADGKRVPGVTTITGRFKDSKGLMFWAHQQGLDGLDMNETRDNAATVGKIAHSMIDADIHGTEYKPDPWILKELVEKARTSLGAYLVWREASKLVVVSTEAPLVSERYRYGGTYDAVGRLGDEWVIIDWKTSNKVFGDYICQLGGYLQLIEENTDRRPTSAHLLRVTRDHGTFSHHYYPRAVLELGRESFLLMRELYERDKELKKAV